MRRFAIWSVTLTVLSVPLMAAPGIPAFSPGGGGGGGGGPNDEDLMRPRPQYMKPAPTSAPYMKSAPTPAPAPAARSSHRSKKADKQSFLDDPAFKQGYRTAYDTIYDRHDYAAAIDQLKELGHDDYANVANLIGYSYRKLGDYKLSQVWYE